MHVFCCWIMSNIEIWVSDSHIYHFWSSGTFPFKPFVIAPLNLHSSSHQRNCLEAHTEGKDSGRRTPLAIPSKTTSEHTKFPCLLPVATKKIPTQKRLGFCQTQTVFLHHLVCLTFCKLSAQLVLYLHEPSNYSVSCFMKTCLTLSLQERFIVSDWSPGCSCVHCKDSFLYITPLT